MLCIARKNVKQKHSLNGEMKNKSNHVLKFVWFVASHSRQKTNRQSFAQPLTAKNFSDVNNLSALLLF
jgi:hypothetical protein